MKRIIKKIADKVIKQSILFESKPFFSDNTRPVYEEMIRRGYAKKYNLFWWISDNEYATIKNGVVSYWNPGARKTIKEKIRNYSVYRTKCIICCNKFLPSSGDDQTSFYLTHGTPMKSVRDYYSAPDGIDFSISAAPGVSPIFSKEFNIPEERIFGLGFPRNDAFAKDIVDLNRFFNWNYKKIIIWYPTYRQANNHYITLSGNSLPLIHNEDNAIKLNRTAEANNVLIIVKPHFAQDTSLIKDLKLSNVLLINDDFFGENGITSYQLLAASDALITDYSSVYFDYTLRDKPIAVIWEDIEEYQKFPGFALDLTYYLKGAEKIYRIEELCSFVESVANDEDPLREERREIRDVCNYSTDGNNTKRVVDFIVEKAKL